VLDGLVARTLSLMPLLLRAIDSVALLDVLVAFFQAVSGEHHTAGTARARPRLHPSRPASLPALAPACLSVPPAACTAARSPRSPFLPNGTRGRPGSPHEYVRPRITRSGPLAITAGRHPMIEALLHSRHGGGAAPPAAALPAPAGDGPIAGGGPRAFIANDTYISEAASLHLIAGPNMAGKSTYLRQASSGGASASVGARFACLVCRALEVDRLGQLCWSSCVGTGRTPCVALPPSDNLTTACLHVRLRCWR
jgi:hypothetical protein